MTGDQIPSFREERNDNDVGTMIRPVSSTVSAPAWFNEPSVKRLNRMRWNYHTREASRTIDCDEKKLLEHKPCPNGPVNELPTEDHCDQREIQDDDCCRDTTTEQEAARQEEPSKQDSDSHIYPIENDDGDESTNDATHQTTTSQSLTVLSAFSLITPPNRWIQKDSFLHRRKKLEQWGIPLSQEIKKTTLRRLQASRNAMELEKHLIEETLHERLVWIKYRNKYWWPAVLYDNYRQLIQDERLSQYVWYRLPLFWKRFELATTLVFNRNDPRNHMQVARVLGRGNTNESGTHGTIEVVEVEETWPFKDEAKVAEVIGEMALNGDFFRDHPTLYLDWHRAMDQMELLLSECLGIEIEQGMEGDCPPERSSSNRATSKWPDQQRNKQVAKAVAATLTAIAHPDPRYWDNHDDCLLDDNSLVASTIASSKTSYIVLDDRPNDSSIQNKRKKSWLQRAKDAEHKKWVAKCHDCSTLILDSIENFCIWKDSLVASTLQQPTVVERKRGRMSSAEHLFHVGHEFRER